MKQLSLYALLILFGGVACQKTAIEPAGCEFVTRTLLLNDSYTHWYDDTGRLTRVAYRSSSNEADYSYTYPDSRAATIDITYPKSDYLRIHYDLTLTEQGYVLTARQTLFNRLADGTIQERITGADTMRYSADGYLTAHRADEFSYPPGKPMVTNTYRRELRYQDGNPVLITYSETQSGLLPLSGTSTNSYGTQLNPLKLPLQLETNLPYGFRIDSPLQPLMGKPSRSLITLSRTSARQSTQRTDSTRFVYQFDAKGQLVQATRQPGAPNVYSNNPFSYSFENRCP